MTERVDLDAIEKRALGEAEGHLAIRVPPSREEVLAMIAELRAHREALPAFRALVAEIADENFRSQVWTLAEAARAALERLERR